MKLWHCAILVCTVVLALGQSAYPQILKNPQALLDFALAHSLESDSASAEVKAREAALKITWRSQFIPQISLGVARQSVQFDREVSSSSGALVENNGENTVYGATVTFDLQKIFSGDLIVARQGAEFAKIQKVFAKREVIRAVKKSYALIKLLENDIRATEKVIGLFRKLNGVLRRQSGVGVYNELERRQFALQQSMLESDLLTKTSDLDAAYVQLSLILNADLEWTRHEVEQMNTDFSLSIIKSQFERQDHVVPKEDGELTAFLQRDEMLSRTELENYRRYSLPALYVKASRDRPNYPSSDGPSTVLEAGITLPVDAAFIRGPQKAQMQANFAKAHALAQKAILDYRGQLRLAVVNAEKYALQAPNLAKNQNEASKLIDRSFTYFSQRRTDAMGTLDIFQKYLVAEHSLSVNRSQIQMIDADLEYFTGGPK